MTISKRLFTKTSFLKALSCIPHLSEHMTEKDNCSKYLLDLYKLPVQDDCNLLMLYMWNIMHFSRRGSISASNELANIVHTYAGKVVLIKKWTDEIKNLWWREQHDTIIIKARQNRCLSSICLWVQILSFSPDCQMNFHPARDTAVVVCLWVPCAGNVW